MIIGIHANLFIDIDIDDYRTTANEYPDLENTIQIKKYSKDHIMKAYLLEKSHWTGKCPADKDFDYVRWLNGEDIFNANKK